MIALVMVGLLTMAALLTDGGMAYAQRRSAQNAADAGAIAGARQLALSATDSQINATVREYTITRNGATTYTATYYPGGQSVGGGTVPGNATGVQVTAHISFATFFAPIFGQTHTTVAAATTASTGIVSQPGDSLQPLARNCMESSLSQCGFQYGQSYDIWQGQGTGSFGWLSWDGSNDTPYLVNELTPGSNSLDGYVDPHGTCTDIATGCWVWVQQNPGVKNSSAVRTELNTWIALGAANPPTPMIIVIYDTSENSGSNLNYHIVGFAAFILQSDNLPQGHVIGKFVQWMVAAPVGTGTKNFGVFSPHLIKP